LTVAIPEIYLSQLKKGNSISFKVTAIPEKIFKARLSRTSERLDENTRSLMADLMLII